MNTMHRRNFHATVWGGVAATVLTTSLRGADSPSNKITLGFIGMGMMGRGHLGAFLGMPQCQVVAVSDIEPTRLADAKKTVESRYSKDKAKGTWKGVMAYTDFRDLLARKDIDAVVIATPDHWHAAQCVLAAQAKKDIYCEKPLTNSIAQGRRVVEAVAKHERIFQTGSQQRSEFGGKFKQAAEYIRNGRIGKLKRVRIGVSGPARACDLKESRPPAGTDWDMWLGPAAYRGYSEVLCPVGIHKHFPAWREFREFAGGGLADMGAHHFDIAQWAMAMDHSGPVKVVPPEDEKLKTGLKFIYENGVEVIHGGPSGCTFEGTEGSIYVDRGTLKPSNPKLFETPLTDKDIRLDPSTNHRLNWLQCITSRKNPICTAETGHRTSTVCQLGNIGYWLGRPLTWDPAKERFVDDRVADRLLDWETRAPWRF
jgi:predicted dehydrogenase